MAEAHADGVTFRALGTLHGCSPSLACRRVKRVNAAKDARRTPDEREPSSEHEPPGKLPPEDEFGTALDPGDTPAPAPPEPLDLAAIPQRAPGQHAKSTMHPLDWAEHKLKTTRDDITRIRSAPGGYVRDRDAKLQAAEATAAELQAWLDQWRDIIDGLKWGREFKWVKTHDQTLTDAPSRALWDNPYSTAPRGFTIVGQ